MTKRESSAGVSSLDFSSRQSRRSRRWMMACKFSLFLFLFYFYLFSFLPPHPSVFSLFPGTKPTRRLTWIEGSRIAVFSVSRDLSQLSSLGHFLKGSSATLGLTKVKDSCEKIQHYGAKKDDTGTKDEPSDEVCLKRIKETLALVRKDYDEVEKVLKEFYGL
jgi:hypothetical protein